MGSALAGFLALLKGKAAGIAVGAGAALVVGLLAKLVPGLIAKMTKKHLYKLLDMKNTEDRELVLSLVKWAEKKLPDKGQGEKKFELVADKLVKMFPFLKRYHDTIEVIIEQSVWKMDAELKNLKPRKR